MALVKCKECGREVSNTARKCPHCGIDNPAIGPGEMFIGFFVGLAILVFAAWFFFGKEESSSIKRSHVQAKSAYDQCVDSYMEEGMAILRRNAAVSFSNREVLRREAIRKCIHLN